jgi:hypothetical protein
MSYSKQPSEYQARKVGALHTNEFRCYLEKDGVPISPFHDIPLYANEQQTILNMIVEIPRWSNAKLEVRLAWLSKTAGWPVDHTLDLQRRIPQPHQARRQEGQAAICSELLPPQGLSVELWCFPQGVSCQQYAPITA